MYSFPWGSGELEEYDGPDTWQEKILKDVRDGLLTPAQAIQIAVSSGHGVGKSALVAWLILWSLATFEDTKGIVTANTATQLSTKTWAELAKWYRLFIAKHWFVFTATSIYSVEKEHEKTWRFDAIPWSETHTEAFAGLHNKGRRVVLIFDEASAIPDSIWEVAEGALTDKDTELLWITFGNPTRNTGRFHACFNSMRHRWKTMTVDSRDAKMTNKEQLNQWIADYGEDSDFCRVRVRGIFPNTSDNQFIPTDVVQKAKGKHLDESQYNFAPKIIGVDPAWTGGDETVVVLRQGLASQILTVIRKNDDDFYVAGLIAKLEDEHKVDAVMIDLGYGTGIYSAGKQMHRQWTLIPFGGKSSDLGFANKRAEMWNLMKQWLTSGGAIPNDPTLATDLTSPEAYVVAVGPNAGKIILESKDDMKKRGLASPNRADALALTFAMPVLPKAQQNQRQFARPAEYDPFK